MGTDIHGVFQRHDKTTGRWLDVPSNYEQGRHYQLFAVLANVRNGLEDIPNGGFVTPIAEPRGLPADFLMEGDVHPLATLECMDPRCRKWHGADEKLEVWMGDHSHSWLTGDEILSWAEKTPKIMKTDDSGDYRVLTNVASVQAVEDTAGTWFQSGSTLYVRLHDDETPLGYPTSATGLGELAYFFDEVARLVAEHGSVRFVFGFDN